MVCQDGVGGPFDVLAGTGESLLPKTMLLPVLSVAISGFRLSALPVPHILSQMLQMSPSVAVL
jgi:hypothetical protein